MLEILHEMQAKLDLLVHDTEKLEEQKLKKTLARDEARQKIDDEYKSSIESIENKIRENQIEHSSITYSVSIAKAVAAHYEAKAEEKLEADAKAAGELYQAATTGGASEEDWTAFFDSTCLDVPDELKPKAEEEDAQEPLEATG